RHASVERDVGTRERPGREVHVGVGETGENHPAAQIDDVGRGERSLMDADAARDAVARDRERSLRRDLRVHRPDETVLEDQGSYGMSRASTMASPAVTAASAVGPATASSAITVGNPPAAAVTGSPASTIASCWITEGSVERWSRKWVLASRPDREACRLMSVAPATGSGYGAGTAGSPTASRTCCSRSDTPVTIRWISSMIPPASRAFIS